MRRLLAACLLMVFAFLVTADTYACPDGCQSAGTASAADHCDSSGSCVFCTGGVVALATPGAFAPLIAIAARSAEHGSRPAVRPPAALDHPPRQI